MIYYVSDLHFRHKNIIKYDNRPYKDVLEMEEDYINRWNKVVKDTDTVYILGDFAFGGISVVKEILSKLKGEKIFVKGNHDKAIWKYREELMREGLLHGAHDEVCRVDSVMYVFGQTKNEIEYVKVLTHKPITHERYLELYNEYKLPVLNIHGHLHKDNHRDCALSEDVHYLDVCVGTAMFDGLLYNYGFLYDLDDVYDFLYIALLEN